VLVQYPVKNRLTVGRAPLLPLPLLRHLSVMISLPGRIPFRVDGICLIQCGEQPSRHRFQLILGRLDLDLGHPGRYRRPDTNVHPFAELPRPPLQFLPVRCGVKFGHDG